MIPPYVQNKLVIGIPAYNYASHGKNLAHTIAVHQRRLLQFKQEGKVSRSSCILVGSAGSGIKQVNSINRLSKVLGAQTFTRKFTPVGLGRMEIASYAFNKLKAHKLVLHDDDSHQWGRNIENYINELRFNDLVIGSRSAKCMLGHPLPQLVTEEIGNLIVNGQLKLPSTKGRLFFPDYVSGGVGINYRGWNTFENLVNWRALPKDTLSDVFIPAAFSALFLQIKPIDLVAPYEARYFVDGFSLKNLKRRLEVLRTAIRDVKSAEDTVNKNINKMF